MFSKWVAESNLRIDRLCEIVDKKPLHDARPVSNLDLLKLKCPLSTVEDIEDFENSLKDQDLFNELVI